jgi:hypothetical protein
MVFVHGPLKGAISVVLLSKVTLARFWITVPSPAVVLGQTVYCTVPKP